MTTTTPQSLNLTEPTLKDESTFREAWSAAHAAGQRSGREFAGIRAVFAERGLGALVTDAHEHAFHNGTLNRDGDWVLHGLRAALTVRLASENLEPTAPTHTAVSDDDRTDCLREARNLAEVHRETGRHGTAVVTLDDEVTRLTAMLPGNGTVPLATTVHRWRPIEDQDPVSALQSVLMLEWARVSGTDDVGQNPGAYIETFRDLAKAAMTHLGVEWREVNRIAPDA